MIDVAIFDKPNGLRIYSCSYYTDDVVIRTDGHGFASLSCFVPRNFVDVLVFYQAQKLLHVAATDACGVILFEGRLEDQGVVAQNDGSGFQISAYGYQNAYRDAPYTALWSDTRTDAWRPITSSERGDAQPGRYAMDTSNRLYMSPRKNEAQSNLTGAWFVYQIPDQSSRHIVGFSFNYSAVLPTDWFLQVIPLSTGFSAGAAIFSLTGTGALQTGSQNLSFSTTPYLGVRIVRNNGTAAAHPNDEGVNYALLTNLRVTTQATPIDGQDIASALVDYVAGINSTQVNTSKSFISNPGYDLRDEVYEDVLPADILDKLIALGDSATPPNLWEWAVWEDRVLRFQQRGATGRTWYIDAAVLTATRTYSGLVNSAYATYQDASGRTLRTAISTDSNSVSRHGLTRRKMVSGNTTYSPQALVTRDAVLIDKATIIPQVAVEFEALYSANNVRVPVYYLRSGDTLVLRNIPILLAQDSKVTSFRVIETEYSGGVMRAVPENYTPVLETMLARREERI